MHDVYFHSIESIALVCMLSTHCFVVYRSFTNGKRSCVARFFLKESTEMTETVVLLLSLTFVVYQQHCTLRLLYLCHLE